MSEKMRIAIAEALERRDIAAAMAMTVKPWSIPADVIRLVVAARVVVFETQDAVALRELDQATEAFSSRVPWEDQPHDN